MKAALRKTLLLSALGASLLALAHSPLGQRQLLGREVPGISTLKAGPAAPEFPTHLKWLNTPAPLTLAQFQGKAVLLDFWTFCCINCMHILPDLARLEKEHAQSLQVIGVHSGKFANERGDNAIAKAIARYGIHHPVINDKDFEVWEAYGARAWPTLVLINPQGQIVAKMSGEGIYEPMHRALLAIEKSQGLKAQAAAKAPQAAAPKGLRFPGKVLADEKNGRLFVADSGQQRVLVFGLKDLSLQAAYGSGQAGMEDGPAAKASFSNPQGMALSADGKTLYVADTGNHAIRKIDLLKQEVYRVAGTGRQAGYADRGGLGRAALLNSPWDLALDAEGKSLYVAMAGAHQIWVMKLGQGAIYPIAGRGDEDLRDGRLDQAALAQPSGLALSGDWLYVADSETSSLRQVPLQEGSQVKTLVGKGLFDFGDKSGALAKARLQHPLGVAWRDGVLYVADTYNSKIKRLDLAKQEIHDWAGRGQAGLANGQGRKAEFDEPGGLSVLADGSVIVADTNNHLLRRIDAQGQVTTLELKGI